MGRWPTGSRERLQQAALALFVEKGFDQTSVSDIASRAGVTERTFYRQFGEKREVLFDGGESLQLAITEHLSTSPPDERPLEAAERALMHAATEFFSDRLPFARKRQSVIDANPELQERELLKMASLVDAIRDSLASRDVPETASRLAAEMGVAAFKVAFGRWIDPANGRSLADLIRDCLDEMRDVAAR
ncbi:TetR family transcriptional regulator [Gordonia hankookensis]|uniref:TetR family transcriptional regulator n=1 Tax=Gordonia hankookensis TaxID=589403 RepID=A0ABR7WA89_9ACTN|nr:TetR family transcriptional regulator [Gordonia hankookensis]MBD1319717.1 TetR family transcriptional regulator [Gordonia hankookensis]